MPGGGPRSDIDMRGRGAAVGLPSQAELGDKRAIAAHVFPVEVSEQAAAAADHLEQAAPSGFVVLVNPKVLCQVIDARSQNGDLQLSRAGVVLIDAVFSDDGLLFSFVQALTPGGSPIVLC